MCHHFKKCFSIGSISIQGIPASKASEIPLQNRKDIKLNKIQVSQTVSTSPGFWIAQRFFTKELSFYVKMTDAPLSCKVPRRPIFLLMRLAVLWAKMTTCFFIYQSWWPFFFPFLLRHKGGKKLLSFQCPFVSLPVTCDPFLFDFICSLSSLLFTVIYWNGHAEKLDIYFKWHWETAVIVSTSACMVTFFNSWKYRFSEMFVFGHRISYYGIDAGFLFNLWTFYAVYLCSASSLVVIKRIIK